jgi:hypothetical protein
MISRAALTCLATLVALGGCTGGAPPARGPWAGSGELLVYSATFTPTLEEGEYPAHTDYSIATTNDQPIERVSNQTGSFDKRPATVSLAPGEYHIRAQYDRGGFVTIPVVIEAGKMTTIDLDGRAMPKGGSPAAEPIRVAGEKVVGWKSVEVNQPQH